MKRILLVAPFLAKFSRPVSLPPLGIAYIAAYAQAHGYICDCINGMDYATLDDLSQRITDMLIENSYDVCGFSVLFDTCDTAIHLAKKVKELHPSIYIVFGGIHASVMHTQILEENTFIDAIVRNEGEIAFKELLDKIAAKEIPNGILGITYRDGNKVVTEDDRPLNLHINDLPFPVRQLHSKKHYQNAVSGSVVSTYNVPIVSSRGCPYQCSFCAIPEQSKNQWRPRTAKNVLEEIRTISESIPIGLIQIYFIDDNFCVDVNRIMEIAENMHTLRNGEITFCFATRATQIIQLGKERLMLLRKYGCLSVEIGLENGADTVLERYRKETTANQNTQAIALCRECGIRIAPDFILFDKYTTLTELRENAQFIKQNALQNIYPPIIYNRVIPYPGTAIYNEGVIDMQKYFDNRHTSMIFDHLVTYMNTMGSTLYECVNLLDSTPKTTPIFNAMQKRLRRVFGQPFSFFEEILELAEQDALEEIHDISTLDSYRQAENMINEFMEKYKMHYAQS